MNLAGKVAVVTGVSRGLGKAIAIDLARSGAKVVAAARSEVDRKGYLPGTIIETVQEDLSFSIYKS